MFRDYTRKASPEIFYISKCLFAIACFLMIFTSVFYGGSVWASAQGKEAPRRSDDEYITAEDWPEAPEISAGAAVLIEADSGMVLYAKNADSKRFPASITKILTALITIENSDLSDTLVFKGEALTPLPEGYVSIDPSDGERMSVEDCLNGLLLASANDAANALAVHNSGTIAAFAVKMNERAARAGALHTHFTNPSGLADENHYTTPYDMAMIMRDCIQHEEFLEIAGSLTYTIPATNTHAARKVDMRHEMLKKGSEFYYEYCKAGKTGFTSASGYTLVTYAQKDGRKLLCCVMQCEKNEQYRSTRALFDYGFDSFDLLSENEAKSPQQHLTTESYALNRIQTDKRFVLEKVDSSSVILPAGLSLKDLDTVINYLDPEKESDGCFAEASYMYEGMKLGESRLRLSMSGQGGKTGRTKEVRELCEKSQRTLYICLAGIAFALLLAILLSLFVLIRYRKEKKKMETVDTNRVDFEHAKQVFEQYLDGYDREDDKVRLKITHTYCVLECSRQIAVRMGLSREDVDLAMLIGLLHDIGRFEQLKRYDSFEPTTMDHAMEGVHILFDEGMIRQFIKDDQYDEVIRTAIARHSDFELKGIEDERTLLHARLIRDADKLDNCRVKLEDSVEVLLNKTPEEVGREAITDQVFQSVCDRHSVYSPDRRTAMDYWVSYVAYVYDINFKETLQIIKENDYMSRIIHRIPCENKDTAEKMKKIEADINTYLETKTA